MVLQAFEKFPSGKGQLVLIFMRHGSDDFVSGHLLPAGVEQVRAEAQRLSEILIPDKILSSCADRARQTAEIVRDVFSGKVRAGALSVSYNEGLAYSAEGSAIFVQKFLPRLGTDFKTVLCVSHNETISTNLSYLTGTAISPGFAESMILKFRAKNWAEARADTLVDAQQLVQPVFFD